MAKKIYKFRSPAFYSWNAKEYSKSTMLTWNKNIYKSNKSKLVVHETPKGDFDAYPGG